MGAEGLQVLAVDDERPPLEDLVRLLRSFPTVAGVQSAHGGHEALSALSREGYDAIFLDVRMPDLDGLELARVLRRFAEPPALVFVSAYDHAAVDAFELRALDYLRKPVSRRRLEEALQRVEQARRQPRGDHAPPPTNGHTSEMVAVANLRSGGTRLVPRAEILYAQSHGDFVRIVTPEGRFLLRATLSDLDARWESHGFVRVHRQYLANLSRAVELRPLLGGSAELVFPGGVTIPVARRHTAELGRRLRA